MSRLPTQDNEIKRQRTSERRLTVDDRRLNELDARLNLGHHRTIWGGLNTFYYQRLTGTSGADTPSGDGVIWREIVGNFDWSNRVLGHGFPVEGIAPFASTHWQMFAFGLIRFPALGSWTVYTTSDDGHRVRVGDQTIASDWVDHPSTEVSATFPLGGSLVRPIAINHYQGTGSENYKLEWSGPGTARQVIPASALGYEWPIWWPVGMTLAQGAPADGADFQNGWHPFGDTWAPMYRVLPHGEVNYRGLVRNASSTFGTIATVPYPLRPPNFMIFPAASPSGMATPDLRLEHGRLSLWAGVPDWLTLTGVRYYVDPTNPELAGYFSET